MIWVLTDDYNLEFIEWTAIKGAEDILAYGVYHTTAILTLDKRDILLKIGLRELILEYLLPILCYANICHSHPNSLIKSCN
jgi:hypothetical protein